MKKSVKKNNGVKREFSDTIVESSPNKKRRIETEEMKGLPIDIMGEVFLFLNSDDFVYS